MNKKAVSFVFILVLLLLLASLLVSCGAGNTTSTPSIDGKTIMEQNCANCHSLSRVTSAHKTAAQWDLTVQRMLARGVNLDPSQQQSLVDFLSANY